MALEEDREGDPSLQELTVRFLAAVRSERQILLHSLLSGTYHRALGDDRSAGRRSPGRDLLWLSGACAKLYRGFTHR